MKKILLYIATVAFLTACSGGSQGERDEYNGGTGTQDTTSLQPNTNGAGSGGAPTPDSIRNKPTDTTGQGMKQNQGASTTIQNGTNTTGTTKNQDQYKNDKKTSRNNQQ